ncbi:hypothetical protein LNQ81_12975 [Myroides sp. M-43]|uniref:hypothetical protein n=1 Tax=Myroides oncorhynchi TaxID=2893756 RepID=UPI001E60852E|nr:hypothetical protein [Myroides oncorhynchi]MCC9043587.1 hypothetical protein [Myroides oncorhynchi]
MLAMFLGLYWFLYLTVAYLWNFICLKAKKQSKTAPCIVGQSNTKLNYKKLNKTSRPSESLIDLLNQSKDDSAKEIAKRLG